MPTTIKEKKEAIKARTKSEENEKKEKLMIPNTNAIKRGITM